MAVNSLHETNKALMVTRNATHSSIIQLSYKIYQETLKGLTVERLMN